MKSEIKTNITGNDKGKNINVNVKDYQKLDFDIASASKTSEILNTILKALNMDLINKSDLKS